VLSENGVWFKYSAGLLGKVKRFIHEGSEFIEPVLKQISRKVKSLNDSQDDNTLFQDKGIIFKESFLAHLSIMHNNLFRFSPPKHILFDKGGESEYLELYTRLLHIQADEHKPTKTMSKSFEYIQSSLIDPLKDKIHTSVKLSSKVVPKLYFNLEVDCIGKNGSLVAAKYIDFSLGKNTVDKHLTHFAFLMDHISRAYSVGSPDVFVLGNEPKSNSETYDMWCFADKSDVFTDKHPDQASEVRDFIIEQNASKFLDL